MQQARAQPAPALADRAITPIKPLYRDGAVQRRAVQHAGMGREVEIAGGAVHEAAVVPHDEIARPPAVAVDEAPVGGLGQQIGQQRPALRHRQPLDMRGIVAEIQPLAAGFRVGADQRRLCRRDPRRCRLQLHINYDMIPILFCLI